MTFESVVTASDEVIDIDGYNYDSVDKDELSITTGENVINIYYTKRTDLSYKVNYLEKDTNKVLDAQKVVNGMTFENVVTSSDEVIEIDGYTYDSVDKDSLTIKTGENVINIYYTKRNDLSYKVNYLEKDTGKVLNAQKVQTGMTFESVVTASDEVIDIDGYNYDSVDKDELVITIGENVINIYYTKRNDLSYAVNYLEKDTNNVLNAQKVQNGMTFESIVIASDEVIGIDGYNFDSVDKDELVITTEENIINIYYTKRNDLSYKVNYLEKDTNKVLHVQKVQNEMTFESVVTASDEVIELDGYNFDSVDKDSLTITTGENVINIYYTKRNDLSYKVNYIEKDTDKILNTQKVVNGMIFESVVTSSDEVIEIDGYTYDSVDKDELTITTEENVLNIYYTKRNDLSYTVNYLESGTNTVLHNPKTQNEMTFETVIRAEDEVLDIEGYNYDYPDKYELVIGTEENIINIYYSKVTGLGYTVNYLEKETNKVLFPSNKQGDMTYGDVVNSNSEIITIDGYVYDSVDKDELTITMGENVINIYYVKRNDLGYIVNYLEKDTNKVLSTQKVQNNVVFESTITSQDEVIEIDGYNFDLVDKDTLTITTGENVINIYYTKRNDLSYIVNYLEKDTNIVIHGQKTVNNVTYGDIIKSSDEIIDIYGYNYGSVDKNELTIGTGANEINIYYGRKEARVCVHYYEEGTTNKVSEDVIIADKLFTRYTTKEATDIPSKYELVDVPENATGEMLEEETVVIYYYRKKATKVIVHHYEEETTNRLSKDVTINGKVDDSYSTGVATDVPLKYELAAEPVNKVGTMTEDVIEVIYYYRVKNAVVNIQYLEKGTNAVLAQQEQQIGKVDEAYVVNSKEIAGFTLVEDSGNTKGAFALEPTTVTFYYLQNTNVIINHIDKNTGGVLSKETLLGLVGDRVTVGSKNFEDYVLLEKPENETPTMTKNGMVLNYYYAHVSGGVIEKHIDIITGEILENEVHEGIEGDSYDISSKTFEGYILVQDKLPSNSQGIMKIDPIEVEYYYLHISKGVIVNYVDVNTGKQLLPEVKIEGYDGDAYETHEENISGYDLVQDKYPANAKGNMTKEEIRVTYYYSKKTEVIVKYIDKETGKEIKTQDTIYGHDGESYVTQGKKIAGYDLVEEPANKNGKMTDMPIEVIYVYRRPAKVLVQYIDMDTNEELQEEEIVGHQNDDYTTEQREIKYYNFVEDSGNLNGKMLVTVTKGENGNALVEDTTYVKYYYKKKTFNLKIDKQITSIFVNGHETPINGKIGKIEVDKALLEKNNIRVMYKVIVTNDSELRGNAVIEENIPDGMKMDDKINTIWNINGNTAVLDTGILLPGKSAEYEVILDLVNGKNNIGTKESVVKIVSTENEAGFEEQSIEDNKSKADFVLSIGTGIGIKVYAIGTGAILMLLTAIGLIIIEKRKNKNV